MVYFCHGVRKCVIFYLLFSFSAMAKHGQESTFHPLLTCPHDRSTLNLTVICPHHLFFHIIVRKLKENNRTEFLKKKPKFIFQKEHSVSHFFMKVHLQGMYLNAAP